MLRWEKWQERGYNNNSAMTGKLQSRVGLTLNKVKTRCEPGDTTDTLTAMSFTCRSFFKTPCQTQNCCSIYQNVESRKMMRTEKVNVLAKIWVQLQILREKRTSSKLIISGFR